MRHARGAEERVERADSDAHHANATRPQAASHVHAHEDDANASSPSRFRPFGHELVIQSRGPWASPPEPAVVVRCSCRGWSDAWSRREFEEAGALGLSWVRILASIEAEYEATHTAAIRERTAARPDASFY